MEVALTGGDAGPAVARVQMCTLKARPCCSKNLTGALATKVTLWLLMGKITAKRPSSSRHHLFTYRVCLHLYFALFLFMSVSLPSRPFQCLPHAISPHALPGAV